VVPYAVLLTLVVATQGAPITLVAPDGTTSTLPAQEITRLPPQAVTVEDRGNTAAYEGALLTDVLLSLGIPTGEALRGPAATMVVLVEGKDTAKVSFSAAELDPTLSTKRVYLVWKRNGAALVDAEGPYRIVIPDEKRAVRWVRGVHTVSLGVAARPVKVVAVKKTQTKTP